MPGNRGCDEFTFENRNVQEFPPARNSLAVKFVIGGVIEADRRVRLIIGPPGVPPRPTIDTTVTGGVAFSQVRMGVVVTVVVWVATVVWAKVIV